MTRDNHYSAYFSLGVIVNDGDSILFLKSATIIILKVFLVNQNMYTHIRLPLWSLHMLKTLITDGRGEELKRGANRKHRYNRLDNFRSRAPKQQCKCRCHKLTGALTAWRTLTGNKKKDIGYTSLCLPSYGRSKGYHSQSIPLYACLTMN